jgi:hypothetical protein
MDRRTWLITCLGMAGAPARATAQARIFKIGILAGSTPTSPESRHIWQADRRHEGPFSQRVTESPISDVPPPDGSWLPNLRWDGSWLPTSGGSVLESIDRWIAA